MGLVATFYFTDEKGMCKYNGEKLGEMHVARDVAMFFSTDETSKETRENLMSFGFLLSKVTAGGVQEVWYRKLGPESELRQDLRELPSCLRKVLEEKFEASVRESPNYKWSNPTSSRGLLTKKASAFVKDSGELSRIYEDVFAACDKAFPRPSDSLHR